MKASHITPQEVMHCIALFCSNERMHQASRHLPDVPESFKSHMDLQSYPEEWQ